MGLVKCIECPKHLVILSNLRHAATSGCELPVAHQAPKLGRGLRVSADRRNIVVVENRLPNTVKRETITQGSVSKDADTSWAAYRVGSAVRSVAVVLAATGSADVPSIC